MDMLEKNPNKRLGAKQLLNKYYKEGIAMIMSSKEVESSKEIRSSKETGSEPVLG